jgi:hypothetical protein
VTLHHSAVRGVQCKLSRLAIGSITSPQGPNQLVLLHARPAIQNKVLPESREMAIAYMKISSRSNEILMKHDLADREHPCGRAVVGPSTSRAQQALAYVRVIRTIS